MIPNKKNLKLFNYLKALLLHYFLNLNILTSHISHTSFKEKKIYIYWPLVSKLELTDVMEFSILENSYRMAA